MFKFNSLIEVAVANQGRTMETDTISKYGQSAKCQTNSRLFFVFIALLIAVLMTNGHQASAQNKSNGVIELISYNVADTIIFKVVDWKSIKHIADVSVFLVVKKKETKPKSVTAYPIEFVGEFSMSTTPQISFTEDTKFYFKFIAPKNPEKIKFVINNKTMFFNLVSTEWE